MRDRSPARFGLPTASGMAVVAGAVVAVAVLGPVLVRRGYVLSYDMVFVPDPPLSARVLGVDGSVPRAVPSDLLVVALSRVAPADLVQKSLLALTLVLAFTGAARLVVRVGGGGRTAAVVAGMVYVWSPYVAERLVLGHWALLLGYAALPWAVEAASRLRTAQACAWTSLAAVGGANAWLLVVPGVAVTLAWCGGGSRRPVGGGGAGRGGDSTARPSLAPLGLYLVFAGVMALPWALPAVLRPGGLPSDPAGVRAFAAHADSPLGVIGSLVTLGGIWNPAVVPPERHRWSLALLALVVVTAALVTGLAALWRRGSAGRAVVTAGVLGLLLAAASAQAPFGGAVAALAVHVPGGGVLRDAQKLLAPWALLVAVCAGLLAQRAAVAARRFGVGGVVALGAVLLPVALLPNLAWGAHGRLGSVAYPAVWSGVRAAMAADPRAGDVVVLPWGPYRRFDWNAGRVVLDPVQRVTARAVAIDDDLPLRGGTVRGEDARARQVAALLAAGGDLDAGLSRLGFRFVVVHSSAAGADEILARLGKASCVVCADAGLRLYALDDVAPTSRRGSPVAAVVAGDGLAATALTGVLAALVAGGLRRRRRRKGHSGRGPSRGR